MIIQSGHILIAQIAHEMYHVVLLLQISSGFYFKSNDKVFLKKIIFLVAQTS